LLEILATSSFSPSAQKQEAGWVYAFFFPKRKLGKEKTFFERVSEHLLFFEI